MPTVTVHLWLHNIIIIYARGFNFDDLTRFPRDSQNDVVYINMCSRRFSIPFIIRLRNGPFHVGTFIFHLYSIYILIRTTSVYPAKDAVTSQPRGPTWRRKSISMSMIYSIPIRERSKTASAHTHKILLLE